MTATSKHNGEISNLNLFLHNLQMFLQAGNAQDGRRSIVDTTVYAVAEGDEPAFFTSFFNWDSSKQVAAVSAT
jgi:advillin